METLEAIQRRIQSAVDLHGIVRTMKMLSAANIRQFERASEAVNVYSQTIDMGLRMVLRDRQAPAEPSARGPKGQGAIVFGSDQGMCGQFNETIVAFLLEHLRQSEQERAATLVIGLRAAARLQESEHPFQQLFPVPSSADGINASVQSLLMEINSWREQQSLEKVFLYFNRPVSGSAYQPARVPLFPIDVSALRQTGRKVCASRSLPMHTVPRDELQPLLLRQYLFVQLYRAYADSLTSENTSRLLTMQAAEKNIEERLGELRASYHSQRQGAITSELLDIVSGFEVLAD